MAQGRGVTPALIPAKDVRSDQSPIPAILTRSLAALVFAGSFTFRITDPYFFKAHFFYLSPARWILLGEIPVRDFFDVGGPLTYYASAAAQALFGYRLLSEALLACFLLAIGYTLTFLLATRASRSLVIGLVITIMAIATVPRLYSYRSVLLHVGAIFFFWKYIDERSGRNLVLVALWTALAFLFRHDHGLYIAVAALVMVAAAHWRDGYPLLLRRSALYVASLGVLLSPFFAFLALHGGIIAHFRPGFEYSRIVARTEWYNLQWPSFVIVPSKKPLTVEPDPLPLWRQIHVRWAAGVSAAGRAELEQQYHLGGARFLSDDPRGRTWRYELLDTSKSNVSALVEDPRVEDTEGIDRGTYRLTRAPRVPFLALLLRPGLLQRDNAIAWLYYLFVGLPVVAVGVLLLKRYRPLLRSDRLPFETPKILCAAFLAAGIDQGLFRHPLDARIGDVSAPAAVLGAWLLGQWLDPCRTPQAFSWAGGLRFWCALKIFVAAGLVGVTWMAIVVTVDPIIGNSVILLGPRAVMGRVANVVKELGTSPPIDAWAPVGSTGLKGLIRYVHGCTKPTDRLIVTWFAPELFFYSGRAFAGGQKAFHHDHFSSAADQRVTLARLERQSVPIVLVDVGRYKEFEEKFALVHRYLLAHYTIAREFDFGERYRILIDRRAIPSGTYAPLSLPCFK